MTDYQDIEIQKPFLNLLMDYRAHSYVFLSIRLKVTVSEIKQMTRAAIKNKLIIEVKKNAFA